uniref:ZZ-type domain-containing protein n=1 Tax=Arcella intermedia TaxID=1963864 RepID=A0A6B2LAQ6_9EUKA
MSRHSRNHVQIKMASRNYSPFYTSAEMLTKKALQLEINEDSKTHLGFECGGCGLKPIHGVRYVCLNCGLTSLCQKCEAKHHRSHVFLKFRYPFKEALSPEYHQLFIEGASGVIPRKALRESTPFLPTLPATIPLHQNPLSEGMWIMYVYSTSQDYKPKPPLYFKLWRIDEEQPTGTDTNTNTVTVTDQETSVSFKMTCRNTVLEGKMNPKAILLCVADNNVGMGERQGDGYVGYLNLMDEWIVFKLKKKTEQDPDETDSLQPPRPDNDGDTSSDEY